MTETPFSLYDSGYESYPYIAVGVMAYEYESGEVIDLSDYYIPDETLYYSYRYDDIYGKVVDEIKLRHNVRPGITGWAQIHGLRGDVADEEENRKRTKKRIEHDIWYIENWSFTLDIQIIVITVWKMIRGKTQAK